MRKALWTLTLIATVFLTVSALAETEMETKTATLKEGIYAKMQTAMGDMIIELYEKEAPGTVKNFVELAEGKKRWKDPQTGEWQTGKPIYDNTTFHRIVKGFMVQGGDPSGTGSGDVGFTIPMEKSRNLPHDRVGRLAMARRADPDSASSQFYITFGPTTALDNPDRPYAVFGQVIHGIPTLKRLEMVETKLNRGGEKSAPVETVHLKKVEILRVEKDKTQVVSYQE